MTSKKFVKIGKIVCVILSLIIIGLQFIPNWYVIETRTESRIVTYEEYQALVDKQANMTEEELAAETETPVKQSIIRRAWWNNNNQTNAEIYMPVLVLIFAFLTIFLYLKNSYSYFTSIFALLPPIIGLMGFLTVPMFQNSDPLVYTLNMIVLPIALVCSVVTFVVFVIDTVKEIRDEKNH